MPFQHFLKMHWFASNPNEISKKGNVPTNGSIFFTIFQTFMSGKNNKPLLW